MEQSSAPGVPIPATAVHDRLERLQKRALEMLDADNQHDDPHSDLPAAKKSLFESDEGPILPPSLLLFLLHSFLFYPPPPFPFLHSFQLVITSP